MRDIKTWKLAIRGMDKDVVTNIRTGDLFDLLEVAEKAIFMAMPLRSKLPEDLTGREMHFLSAVREIEQ